MEKTIVGIDLGTTFSAVAHVDDSGVPQVIENADGKTTTPSVVVIRDGVVQVGDVAVNQWITDEEHVVRWIKRAMGDPKFLFQGKTAVEISAEILKVLKADAEASLGRPIDEAVITCPAYFLTVEIENTREAGQLAGLNVREIVKEPTAAAVFYGVDNMSDGDRVMICDLGGGTYDACVMAYENGVFSPLSSMGSRECGGHDWTMALVELAAERLVERLGDDPRYNPIVGQKLYEECEKAKRSFARSTEVSIPCAWEGRLEQVVVTRDEFEHATEWLVGQVVGWTQESLAKGELTWNDINTVLLVGGSSRLRRFGEAVGEVAGKAPVQCTQPDLAVALGAAILGAGKVRSRRKGGLAERPGGGLVEVSYSYKNPCHMGTRAVVREQNGLAIRNAIVIPRNTETPATCSRDDLRLNRDGQPVFHLPVVEFEDDETYRPQRNYLFECLPGSKKGDRVRVVFSYTKDSACFAQAFDVNTGQELSSREAEYTEPDLNNLRLAAQPAWAVFALDVSGSMAAGERMRQAKDTLKSTCEELLSKRRAEKVGVVSFASTATVVMAPTSDATAVGQAVEGMTAWGGTAMDEGIRTSVQLLREAPAGYERMLVLVTDGMPDSEPNAQQAALNAMGEGVSLFFVGFEGAKEEFLLKLTPNALKVEGAENLKQAMIELLGLDESSPAAASTSGGLWEVAE